MAPNGLHHVTAITADAPANVDFYARLLGLRLIKKTVNFDAPDVYHLYYGDERANPGSVLTFFEFPGARAGRPGAGTVHVVQWRAPGEASLDFWEQRLSGAEVAARREPGALRFADPEGLEHELLVAPTPDPPLTAVARDVPAEHALQGLAGVRALTADPTGSASLLTELGFENRGDGLWAADGDSRHATLSYEAAPSSAPLQGAGSVHHVAWAVADDDALEAQRAIVLRAGGHPTSIIDRQYFHSVYFREPSGVLFELATPAPGFAVDEPQEALGERLSLPPRYESLRSRLERSLTPLRNPRQDDAVA